MNEHTLRVLEYNAILQRLAYNCRSVPGRRKALALIPDKSAAEIDDQLQLIEEMNSLFQSRGGPPDLTFDDLALRLESAKSSGEILEPLQLLQYSSLFSIVSDCQKIDEKYSNLKRIMSGLVYPEDLHKAIGKSIDDDGAIRDTASKDLFDIRREFRRVKAKLDERFEKFLNSSIVSYLSDRIFTIREGRYVLPVRETDKGQVEGIIHDRSSSGATFFIEPAETVKLNNLHRELETAEREEINRILRRLSELLYINSDLVKTDVELLSQLDFVAACSRLAAEFQATRPLFSSSRELNIKNGRHPVLILHSLKQQNEVVPLDVSMKNESRILIVTGPNTGGKTVALKTIGLLSIMAAGGLFVTADEGSTFILFDDIFADIGDEQSIDSSLSTYSSHLSHIRTAVDESGGDSLVLLDELGAGTDPDEGSVIGQAIVEHLSGKRCFAVITTHHGRLKALAGRIDGVVNGSMDFDAENLTPTFKFLPEIPGSSYAIEIAKRLGLNREVTERALQLLGNSEADMTDLLNDLHRKSRSLAEELEKAASERSKQESLARELEEKLAERARADKKFKKEGLEKIEGMLEETKHEIESMIDEAKSKSADLEALRSFRKKVGDRLDRTRKQMEEFSPKPSGHRASGLPGEEVYISGVDASGEVIEAADSSGRVKVRVGNITMITDLERLYSRNEKGKKPARAMSKTDYSPEPRLELDIRGATFDEALPILEKYLDDAGVAGLARVSIIHGKGTGALRKKVHDYLSRSSRVESFRLGDWNEGSSGATIVELKAEK